MKFSIIIEIDTDSNRYDLKIKDAGPEDGKYDLGFHKLMSSYLDLAANNYRNSIEKEDVPAGLI